MYAKAMSSASADRDTPTACRQGWLYLQTEAKRLLAGVFDSDCRGIKLTVYSQI